MRIRSKNSGLSRSRWSRGLIFAALSLVLSFSASDAQETLDVPIGTVEDAPEEAAESVDIDDPTTAKPESATPGPAPEVDLDQLLRLPNSLDFKEERRGGDGAADWRRRFKESQAQVAEANKKLADAEGAMGDAATAGSGQWQIAPPGQQANSENNGPLSFKLREELRRARAAVETAERQHRALVVEADLAEVPDHWRRISIE